MYLTRWKSAPESQTETVEFKYGLLKSFKTGIRLAQLLPGSGSKGINIDLIDSFVTGPQSISYDALSYTWGSREKTKSIICNGKRLPVTQTLLEALHRFRDPSKVVTLWVDQICICQDRIRERNQQVQLMGKIFKGARKVVVWLGEDANDSKYGMQLANQLLHISRYQSVSGLSPSDLEAHGLPKKGHRRWTALSAILRRPWFWRTWIVQEVVLNPNVELVLGASSLTWDELESIVTLLEGPMPKLWQLDQAISASVRPPPIKVRCIRDTQAAEILCVRRRPANLDHLLKELPFSRINRIRLRHQRQIYTPVSPLQTDALFEQHLHAVPDATLSDVSADDPELLDLLMMSRGLGATDPRDKIYALLGIGKHDVDPDYSMSAESVFTDFALQMVGAVTSLDAMQKAANLELSSHRREVRRAMILISCAGRHNQKLDLPSWVPDWTVNLSARALVFGASQRFAAGGDILGSFDWNFDSGLQLCGKFLDTIEMAGSVLLDYETETKQESLHTLVEQWWQEARQIAVARIARSPGSTMNVDAFEAMRRDLSLCKHGYVVGSSQRARRNSLLDDLDTSDEAHSASQTLIFGPTRGRVVCTSSTGFVGLVPYGSREGDLIFVIMGADIPFILRPYDDGYELVGEAYVQGIMGGEIMQMDQIPVQDIMIR